MLKERRQHRHLLRGRTGPQGHPPRHPHSRTEARHEMAYRDIEEGVPHQSDSRPQ